jgi:hypothetical protein
MRATLGTAALGETLPRVVHQLAIVALKRFHQDALKAAESAQGAVCSPGINTVPISPESSQRWSNSNKTRASSEFRVTATSVTLRGYRPAGRTSAIAAISAITSVRP